MAFFSDEEVNDLLRSDGYFPSTHVFLEERSRRYIPDPNNVTGHTRWLEREDWDPKDPIPEPIYSESEVDMILREKGVERGTNHFYNERFRLFTPTGPGSGEWRFVGSSSVSGMDYSMARNNNFDVV